MSNYFRLFLVHWLYAISYEGLLGPSLAIPPAHHQNGCFYI
ncbi:MAG: hypothetical protein OJF51_002206 [Nitrospira sp.]|nr:MAG: hypothetical protein OJF51_002206 [Nitrospira sp.]